MTDRKLLVSAGPHVRGGASTTSVMGDVLIALLPAVVASVLVFGTRALLLEVVCVAASILFEYLFRKITKRTNTISDLSAAVTGLLLAMNLPAGFPIWMAIVGCFVAIVIVKQLFGGIGCNFANPAITGRIFLLIAFAGQMTTWPTANSYIPGIDAVSGATPLALIKEGAVDSLPPSRTCSSVSAAAAWAKPAPLPSSSALFIWWFAGSSPPPSRWCMWLPSRS